MKTTQACILVFTYFKETFRSDAKIKNMGVYLLHVAVIRANNRVITKTEYYVKLL